MHAYTLYAEMYVESVNFYQVLYETSLFYHWYYACCYTTKNHYLNHFYSYLKP